MERKLKWMFIIAFFAVIVMPLSTTNLKRNTISEAENRRLASLTFINNEDGTINENFTSDFEEWINDNIGMRGALVLLNAKIQYYVFGVLANNSDYVLGPNGEYNYAPDSIIKTYQHFDLKDEETLQQMAEAYQFAKEYADSLKMQLYYFQCWEKQSIYPEYFPKTVIQHGTTSKTDQIVANISNNTDVVVISPKQELIDGKLDYSTYSRWGDPVHWTDRGAYIGYKKLMGAINENNSSIYKVLDDDDYNITIGDYGQTIFGGIHKEDFLETFEIRNPQAVLTNEKLSLYSEDERHRFFTNENANNRDRVLVLGDSYINNFILDDIAESFYETLIIWGDYSESLGEILDAYNPDILVVENAERCDRTGLFTAGAFAIRDRL